MPGQKGRARHRPLLPLFVCFFSGRCSSTCHGSTSQGDVGQHEVQPQGPRHRPGPTTPLNLWLQQAASVCLVCLAERVLGVHVKFSHMGHVGLLPSRLPMEGVSDCHSSPC